MKTLQSLPLQLCLLCNTSTLLNLFLHGLTWHFLKEDIYPVTYLFINYAPYKVWRLQDHVNVTMTCLMCTYLLKVPTEDGNVWNEMRDEINFTIIYRLHSVSRFLVLLPIFFAEQHYECTIIYFTIKMWWQCKPLKKVHRGTYQAVKPDQVFLNSQRVTSHYNTEWLHRAASDWS